MTARASVLPADGDTVVLGVHFTSLAGRTSHVEMLEPWVLAVPDPEARGIVEDITLDILAQHLYQSEPLGSA